MIYVDITDRGRRVRSSVGDNAGREATVLFREGDGRLHIRWDGGGIAEIGPDECEMVTDLAGSW